MQPLHIGDIKNFIGHYRVPLNAQIIASLDADPHLCAIGVAKETTLIDALYLTKESSAAVLPKAVHNSFRNGGFGINHR